MTSKSQGEIFGIALLFVVIIVGILVYGQIKSLNPGIEEDLENEAKQTILAESTITALQKVSTGCVVERNRDSLEDLMRYCLENSPHISQDVEIQCGSGSQEFACAHSVEILNKSLQTMFTGTQPTLAGTYDGDPLVGLIPFSINISVPNFKQEDLHGAYIDNFAHVEDGLTKDNFRQRGYKRVSAGFQVIPTGRRAVEIDFNLYYR